MKNTIKTPNTKTPIMENPIAKNPCYVVITKKTRNEGLRPAKEFSHMVIISDGKHTATFINDGESVLTLDNFASGQNQLGSKFWMSKADHKLHYNSNWGVKTSMKQQKEALKRFIENCLNLRIVFDGELCIKAYTA